MSKSVIRQHIINKLKQLSEDEKITIEKKMFSNLTNSSIWQHANTIGVTISTPIEWDTTSIINEAWQRGKTVVIPKCKTKTKELIFYQYNSHKQLMKGYADLLEPNPSLTIQVQHDDIDLLIVPGIVFDKKGYRIGFGGGYYDRLLENLDVTTVSLVSELQLIEDIPTNEFDIPVQHLVTEHHMMKV